MKLTLINPDVALQDSYIAGKRALKAEGLHWLQDVDLDHVNANFEIYVAKLLQAAFIRTNLLVPETILWAVVNGEFAGRISIRHELNENLRKEGGHIGYETVPKFRKQGVASEMLKQALPIARNLGISEILITCDDDNEGSIKVIEKNDGVLATKQTPAGKKLKRYYWIKL